MPVEFSVAAYRLGHSMVRQRYAHNRVFPAADFQLFFDFSGLSGGIIRDLAPNPPTAPIPVPVLPATGSSIGGGFDELGPSGGAAVNLTPSRTYRSAAGQLSSTVFPVAVEIWPFAI